MKSMCGCPGPVGLDIQPDTKPVPWYLAVMGVTLLAGVTYALFIMPEPKKRPGWSFRRGSARETSYGFGDFRYTEREENW